MDYLDQATSYLLQLFFIIIVVIFVAQLFLDFIADVLKKIFKIGRNE